MQNQNQNNIDQGNINSHSFNWAIFWLKSDRFFAWILLIGMLLFFITGYGMTKGIIDSKIATNLHNQLLPIVILISFVIHASYATRLAFIRWKIWNIFVKIIWFIVFTATLIGFIYIDQIYQKKHDLISSKPMPTTTQIKTTTSAVNTSTPNPTVSNTTSETTFTLDELSLYNGQNGNPPYVAVDGIVYDMTGVFTSGSHYSHIAGTELTDEFYTKHVESEITKYPVVGKLK